LSLEYEDTDASDPSPLVGLRKAILEPNHSDIAESLNSLALLSEQQGNHAEAEEFYKQIVTLLEASKTADPLDIAVG